MQTPFNIVCYVSWFGQVANLDKSNIKFFPPTRIHAKTEVKLRLGLKGMGPSSIYLGKFSGL